MTEQVTSPAETASSSTPARLVSDSMSPYMAVGLAAFILLGGGLGGWAATTELAGAVIASGTVVVDSNVKKVQHPTGGVVGEIKVRDGHKVAAGDLLIRLDSTVARANLGIVTGQLDELTIRQARLTAERDDTAQLVLPPSLGERSADAAVTSSIASEMTLFQSRRAAREGKKAQLRERIAQLRKEIEGLDVQQETKAEEMELIGDELVGLLQLKEANLVPSIRVMAMKREQTRLRGERAQLLAGLAKARGQIAEIELQIIQIDQDHTDRSHAGAT